MNIRQVSASRFLVALFACFASATSAQAGEWSSGGGNALICFDSPAIPALIRRNQNQIPDVAIPRIRTIEAYDLYEAQLPRGIAGTPADVIPMEAGESPMGYVRRITARYDFLFPEVPNAIRASIQSFRPETSTVNQQHGVEPVTDVNPMGLIDRRNCVLGTMAEQSTTANQSILQLDARLFNHRRHSALSKAVLLLHEFVYKHALAHGHRDSRMVRILVGKMITRGLRLGEIQQAVLDVNFYGVTYPQTLLIRALGDTPVIAGEAGAAFIRTHLTQLEETFRQLNRVTPYSIPSDDQKAVDCLFYFPEDDLRLTECLGYIGGVGPRYAIQRLQILNGIHARPLEFRRALLDAILAKLERDWIPLVRLVPNLSQAFKTRFEAELRQAVLSQFASYSATYPSYFSSEFWVTNANNEAHSLVTDAQSSSFQDELETIVQ